MRKARPSQTSNWTIDTNNDDTELGSQTSLIKTKKKTESSPRSFFTMEKRKTRSKDADDDNSSEKSIPIDTSNAKKNIEKTVKVFAKRKLKKLSNVRSTSQTEVMEMASVPKSIDVVVDIHREFKDEKSQHRGGTKKPNAKMGHKVDKEVEGHRMFSKRNVLQDNSNEKSEMNPVKSQQDQDAASDVRIIDSLDLIEEFKESVDDQRRNAKLFETSTRSRSMSDKDLPSSVEEKSCGRKQWDAPDISQIEESRRPRKRWSKDTTVFRLPETKSVSSTSSIENLSPTARTTKRPTPSVRSSLRQESFLSFDNAAFVSDNEDILRVETDHKRERTKIEMRKISDLPDEVEISSLSNESRGSTNEKKKPEETIITAEHSSESKQNSDARQQKEDTIVNIEDFNDAESNESSPKERVSTRKKKSKQKKYLGDLRMSQSLEETVDRSESSSSERKLLEKDRSWVDKKIIHKDRRAKSRRYSSQDTQSTNEDDDDDRSRKSIQDELVTSSSQSRKSKLEEQLQRSGNKKGHRKDATGSSTHGERPKIKVDAEKKKKKKPKEEKKKDIKLISITIHRADLLETDYITKHPMVKVHIVEAENGKYLKNVHGETGSAYLQPIITGKFDFRENRSMIPVWEEELIFEHDFDRLLKTENEQVLILFEIIDLLSFAEASFNYDKYGSEGCWYKIAWAFLKPVGRNSTLHIDKKIRLQLYAPRRSLKKFDRHTCEIYSWWKSGIREKYPSSLFVTVTSVNPPKLEPLFYRQLSLYDLPDLRNESQRISVPSSESINLPKWTRLAAQSCKIPNEKLFETEVSENGCFFVAFSNDGKYLACVISEEYDYPIVVYEVESRKIHVQFSGHKTFVYALNWSERDNLLLSVSSDQTARVWDVQNQIMEHVELMPHPSYVYCGKFYPEDASVVATGCYDKTARIWVKGKKSKNRDLSQELEGHEGFVNSMCFQKDGNLLTADSVGIIIVWVVKKNRRMPSRKEWHISRKIKVREIEGVTINTIVLHPLESRLLVHSRNHGLRMLDLATGVVLQKYTELNNQRIQSTACISPCGGLILCGGEDSSLNVWNLETGMYQAKYTIDRNFRAVTCVDYHPYDHVLAFSTFGSPSPVRVLKFNKDATGEDVGLKMMETDSKAYNNDVAMSLLNVSYRETLRSKTRKRSPEELPKDRSLPTSRSLKSVSREIVGLPAGGSQEKDERNDNTKLKLQRLKETEEIIKNRSASRLYNIIEKIDRILSNTSRSSEDIESGINSTFAGEQTKGHLLSDRTEKKSNDQKRKSRKSKSSAYSSIDDCLSPSFQSSTASSVNNEVLELNSLKCTKASNPIAKKRSKSAKELRATKVFEDDLSKTLSDSAANSRKIQVYDEIMKTMQQENIESSFTVQANGDNPSFVKSRKNNYFTDHSSSPSSTGTYVVEKADVEKNNDGGSVKVSENEPANHSETKNVVDVATFSENEISMLSNATFTIENEIPVAKPRRKKNLA